MASKKVSGSAARELAEAIRGTQTKAKQATVAYGTVTQAGAEAYVTLDGATSATPVSETAAALSVGDRVAVRIEGGSMAVTGNMTAPATSQAAVEATVAPAVSVSKAAQQTAASALEKVTSVELTAEGLTTSVKEAQDGVDSLEELVRVSGKGVEVARKVSGSYTSTRTLMSDTGFTVYAKDGTQFATYGAGKSVVGPLSGLHTETTSTAFQVKDGSTVLANMDADSVDLYSNAKSASFEYSSLYDSMQLHTDSEALVLYAGTASAPKPVYMTLPPFADGVQNDLGVGFTIDDGNKAVAVIKADSAQLSAAEGWTLSGDVYNYKGGLVFEPLTSSGNLAIGYGMKKAGSGQLNLYGNSVAVSCNSGGFLKVVSGSKSYSLAKGDANSYTITLNGGTGWTLVGVTRITTGSKYGMVYGWNVNTYTGTATIVVSLRNLNESSKVANDIEVETVWIHATL